MEEQTTEQILREQLSKLPKEIRSVIVNIDWETPISQITQKYRLTQTEVEQFKLETMLVIVGIVHPDDFGPELAKAMHISPENLNSIVFTMNESVFKNLRTVLVPFLKKMEQVEGEQTTPVASNTLSREELIRNIRMGSKVPTKPLGQKVVISKPTPTPAPIAPIKSTPSLPPKPPTIIIPPTNIQ